MKRNITRFILKALPFVVVPPALLTMLYVVLDPFGALRRYDSFYQSDYRYNRGMVSVRTLEQNIAEGRKYNSFLLGSSLSRYYPADYWESKLGEDAHAIHLDSSGQSISTLRGSVDYLDRLGLRLDNILIIIDVDTFGWEEKVGLPYIVPAQWRGGDLWSGIAFQWDMYKCFYDRQFLLAYIYWRYSGMTYPNWNKINIEHKKIKFDKNYNETIYFEDEQLLNESPEKYFGRPMRLYQNPTHIARMRDLLTSKTKADLLHIKDVLERHKTDYKIIIGPNRFVRDISKADEAWMRSTFGNRFYDFVRPLADVAVREDTYYDGFHYRPHIAKIIIDSIY